MSRLLYAIARRRVLTVCLALLVGLGGFLMASRLELRTAFSELLPTDDPGVVALRRTQARMGDLSLLLVAIRSPDRDANLRYAEALAESLRRLPPSTCEIATYHVRDVVEFVRSRGWLYLSEDKLTELRDRLRSEILRKKNPLAASIVDDEPLEEVEAGVRPPNWLETRFPGGVLQNQTGTTVWVVALPPGGMFTADAGQALLSAVRQQIASDPPARYHPEMEAHPTGPIPSAIRDREAFQRDLGRVAMLCLTLIAFSLYAYFRRLRVVLLIAVPAVLGSVLSYAVAQLAFGYLTAVTGFLVAFVMGNGTNYAIALLARHDEELAAGHRRAEAVERAIAGLWRPTGLAALACALSYLSLAATSFRGFSQFGVMGAAGCLLAWLATFTVLPALLLFGGGGAGAGQTQDWATRQLRRFGRLVERRPGRVMAVGAAITVVASVGATRFLGDPFEYDFRKLTSRAAQTGISRVVETETDAVFGRWPQPTIILAEDARDVPAIKAAIRRQDDAAPGPPVIGNMASLDDLLPGSPEEQATKLAIIADIRRLASDPTLELLEPEDRKRLDQVTPPADLRPVAPGDLPLIARRAFTERDGSLGRVLLIYPVEKGLSIWNGHNLLRIAAVVQRIQLPDGRVLETGGSAVVFGAMIRSILEDGPKVTAVSLIAVMLLVLLRIRPISRALLVMGTLLLGVIWMVGAAGHADVRITFLNFIALPFIFGVGVEYAIHIATSFAERGSAASAIASTGGVVALCSWTAIVGYGSLLGATNRALQGLGGVATLGELACLISAAVVLPAAMVLVGRRR